MKETTYDKTLNNPSVFSPGVLPPVDELVEDDTKEDRIGKEPNGQLL